MTPEQAQVGGQLSGAYVHIIFDKVVDTRHKVENALLPFKEVEFYNVFYVEEKAHGLCIRFEDHGALYTYPWHTLARVKVQRFV